MLRAGTGRVDISPRKSMFLWGYPHVERMSTGVNDPLYVTALCLDDGDCRTIAIAADVLFVTAQQTAECRRRIAERTGVPGAHVMISATHTHSAPVTSTGLATTGDPVVPAPDAEYVEQLIQGITDAACEAVEALEPAALAVASAQVDGVGCNRLDPDGPRDPEAGLLVVRRSADRHPLAVQMIYSMHPTVMHEDSTLVSSDFPGYTRRQIENKLPGCRVIYQNGPCGNLSPRYHVRAQTFAEAERLGNRLAGFVLDAIGSIEDSDYTARISVSGRHLRVPLDARAYPSVSEAEKGLEEAVAEYERLKAEDAGHGPVRTAECVTFGAEEVVTMARAQADGTLAEFTKQYAEAEVQVLCAGDVCVVGLPGEWFVEYSLDMKEHADGKMFVAALANGDLQGYITTKGAKGYEASLSLFSPAAGALLVDAALSLMEKEGRDGC